MQIPSITDIGASINLEEDCGSEKSNIKKNGLDLECGESGLESNSCKSMNVLSDQEGVDNILKLISDQDEMKKETQLSID